MSEESSTKQQPHIVRDELPLKYRDFHITDSVSEETLNDTELYFSFCSDNAPLYLISITDKLEDYYFELSHNDSWWQEMERAIDFSTGKLGIVQMQPFKEHAKEYQGMFQPQRMFIDWVLDTFDVSYMLPAQRNVHHHPEIREGHMFLTGTGVKPIPPLSTLQIHYDQVATKKGFTYDSDLELFVRKDLIEEEL